MLRRPHDIHNNLYWQYAFDALFYIQHGRPKGLYFRPGCIGRPNIGLAVLLGELLARRSSRVENPFGGYVSDLATSTLSLCQIAGNLHGKMLCILGSKKVI